MNTGDDSPQMRFKCVCSVCAPRSKPIPDADTHIHTKCYSDAIAMLDKFFVNETATKQTVAKHQHQQQRNAPTFKSKEIVERKEERKYTAKLQTNRIIYSICEHVLFVKLCDCCATWGKCMDGARVHLGH